MSYHSKCAMDSLRDTCIIGATLCQIKNAVVRLIPSKKSSGSSRFSLFPSWISFKAGVLNRTSASNVVSRFPFKFSVSKSSQPLNVVLVMWVMNLFSKLNVFMLVNKWDTPSWIGSGNSVSPEHWNMPSLQ